MKVGSLFAGIGGLELGLERAGMEVVWQVEIDDFCNRVLEKHWPDVKRYRDMRDVGKHNLEPVDLICGGFPCQDISSSGRKVGLDGQKSGLWGEMARVVRELRPEHVLVENVSDLRVRGLGEVLGDLAALGYDAEWESIPAALFGLPQRRWRVFIVAYRDLLGRQVGDQRLEVRPFTVDGVDPRRLGEAEQHAREAAGRLRGMDDGVPGTVDRLRALGNAVVPQVAEWIGRRIAQAENHTPQLIAPTT